MKVIKTASFNRNELKVNIDKHIKIANNSLIKLSQSNKSTNYMKNIFQEIKQLLTMSRDDLKDMAQLLKDKEIIHKEIIKNFTKAKDIIVSLQRRFPDNPFVRALGKIWSGVGELDWDNANPIVASNAFMHIVNQIDGALDYDWSNPRSSKESLKNMSKVPSRYDRKVDEKGVFGTPVDPSGTKPVHIQTPQTIKGLNEEQGY